VEVHAKLHRNAAQVLKLVEARQLDKARAELDMGGDFHQSSLDTINAIRHLRRKIEKG
jgi:hypothetical protein